MLRSDEGGARLDSMQEKLLDLYTDYLISSFGQVTATGLSRLLDGVVSHDQITRFLASEEKRSADLWRIAKPLVRSIESNDGVIVIDDSIEEKAYTDENELVCWHWDHSKGRNVKGINFLSALYVTDQAALPVAFDLVTKTESYVDKKTGKPKRKSSISKNEDGSQGALYLVTSDLTLDFDRIHKLYQKRWSVEVYHKSLKQNAALERSPTRTETTQRNHLFASLCAYLKLEGLRWQTRLSHFALKSKIYAAALKAAHSELVKLNPQPLAA